MRMQLGRSHSDPGSVLLSNSILFLLPESSEMLEATTLGLVRGILVNQKLLFEHNKNMILNKFKYGPHQLYGKAQGEALE